MARPTLEEIFAEPDEYGLLNVRAASSGRQSSEVGGVAILREVTRFHERYGRLPDPDASDHEEMRLGTIWTRVAADPDEALRAEDHLGLLAIEDAAPVASWRDDPQPEDITESLDDIFADESLEIGSDLVTLRHVTPAAARQNPDHRAEFVVCPDFAQFQQLFEAMQSALDSGERVASIIESRAIIEPLEGDFFIRNGLLAYIAEKTEMSARGGSRDHRLRIIFSNGTESDPLMSSFRKSLNDDSTARVVQRDGLGPLDPEWDADRLALSGTIYVARSLSTDPAIAAERNILHKIGVTSQDVRRRVADARNDPTFLLAPVEIVATFDLRNLARAKVENLLHRFFAPARPADLFIVDRFGKKVRPQEWFYVLPEHVSQAAALLKAEQLHRYRYDPQTQEIVPKKL
ncbi:GIY-YIG nuclease family protein [Devosia sp.]|uniref:GIY-YIG nuclease family protein n=1 Tax=Devosia sp. TaxID=1871048 RepID=UPI001B04FF17|nr:GIY-YIG nuclease family protein [Devosia sp.]MBO9590616.1 GIY-YIG nuclease family protein [Devosia sp.]